MQRHTHETLVEAAHPTGDCQTPLISERQNATVPNTRQTGSHVDALPVKIPKHPKPRFRV